MKKGKSFLAAILALVMVIGSALPVAAANEPDISTQEESLLLHYDFQSADGNTIKDKSSKGNDGTIKGTGATVKDGVLTLPGGAAGSSAAYVELPKGMFDKQDTLTISVWMKNETGAGNYAGMFFGTTEGLPTGYWLLNPANPGGLFKSVITNSYSGDKPYNTEYGISPTLSAQGVQGPSTDTSWALYTTVITPDSLTGYYNGKLVGTVATSRTVSEFGTNLVGYIGRSSYNDKFYKGSVKDLKVYTAAVSASDVANEYYNGIGDEDVIKAVLAEDVESLTLPYSEVVDDITLPVSGKNGSKITWESSASANLDATGKVTRPAEGKGNVSVKLTATLELAGVKDTKEFTVTVLEDSAKNDLKAMLESFELGQTVVTDDIYLPVKLGEDAAVAWSSSAENVIAKDGKVTRPEVGKGDKEVTLTAKVTYKGVSEEKSFKVTVLEAAYGKLLTYVKTGDTDRTDALHYAYSKDGKAYTALHNNRPVLYTNKGSKKMGSPVVFRKADGTYGLITSDNNNSSSVMVYDSKDLITFTNGRYVPVNSSNVKVSSLTCKYNSEKASYVIGYKGGDNQNYEVMTKDFATFTEPQAASSAKPAVAGTLPEKAAEAATFELTKSEYDRLLNKYERVTNTGVEEMEVTVEVGSKLEDAELPEKMTAAYSDGTSKDFGVTWDEKDLAKVDTSKAGTYEVGGTAVQTVYDDILVEQRADPCVYKADDGNYYFTASYPVCGNGEDSQGIGYDRIVLRKSDSISGLADAEEVTIWNQKDSAKANRYIWAPEIHKIGGSWYILFTAARNGGVWDIRPHMLKCMGDDPMNPANWKTADESNLQQVKAAAGDTFAFTNFSLDMTYFESAGKHYVSWAEKPGGISNIYLAEIDPSEPWKLTSKAVLMSTPDFAWEWSGGTIINEGPAVLKHDGKVFLCFSAAAVDYTYCVGMLSADEGADLTDIASWTKYPTPLLSSEDFADQCGPGHNSFTYDENDNPVIVYHARPYSCSNAVDANGNFGNCGFVSPGRDALNDPCRHARVKSLNFAADGTPILNMTADEELTKENRSVTMKVVVKEKEEPIKLPFTDVDENAWYHEYVEYVFVNNIMTGLTDTIFGIDDKLSRAQFATTLYRIEGKPAVTYTEKFKDVPDGLFYTDPVMWASAEGVNVISGYENGNFGPDDKLTREQMAVMLYRYVKYLGYEDLELADFSKFPDADKVSPFAKEAMQWAVAAQIITGDGGNLNPQGDSSRAVCATILTRFMKYTEEIK